jgi:DNA helicase II / ATP-dependent DNA helicase PcrA
VLERSLRCLDGVARAAGVLAGGGVLAGSGAGGEVEFWRCANDRAQAQSVAAEIERLVAREGVAPGQIAVLVPAIGREGQAVAVALEERAVPYLLVGEAAFFQRAEIRDLLAWLRLLADPSDAGAVVRALARPPIELRSVDIARCTQIARRRKLDMVAALAAATESPQVPPEARERIRVFLKLYRAGTAAIDTSRPDVYVHRLIERLGLRRQQLFAAQADVVTRLRALARFGELAAAYVRRSPQATPREFARSIAVIADFGMREQEEPQLSDATGVQVLALDATGALEAEHVYVAGLHAGVSVPACEQIPDALLHERLPADDELLGASMLRQQLYAAVGRARRQVVLAYPTAADRGAPVSPAPVLEELRAALGADWRDLDEELFGPAETLHSTYRLLRDELLEGTMRAGGRLGELRFDTDLDVTHAVVRYLELLKVAALIARPDGQSVAEALRDVNMRILQAVTADQREVFTSSALDDYLLDAERDARRRAQAIAARDEPSLEPFLPKRGDGVVMSASDIDTYRTCPLKYKFARVFRIPQEPTVHQRFGILVHQVLERFHAREGAAGPLPELLGLLDAGWRRNGFGDSEEERQLRGKAAAALTRYHERFQSSDAEPVWFERQFTFKLGPHLLRGRVDRVDRLPGGEYELIDYKTGRPKSAAQLADDVQLSLYAVGAREAWRLDASRQAYYYLLDDQKVTVPALGDGDRAEWIREVATEVAEGILSQGFEPTPSIGACSICDYRLVCPAAER